MSDETYYIKVPTFEDKLREKHKQNYDPQIFNSWRYKVAKPLLRLWERALGKEIAGSIGTIMLVGARVLMHTRIRFYDEPNTHPQDRERYKAEIERLKGELRDTRERLLKADDAARTAENYARALRQMDALIDEKGHEVRNRK